MFLSTLFLFLFYIFAPISFAADVGIPPLLDQLPLDNIFQNGPIAKMYSVAAYVRVNWFTAQQICSQQGMTLASIESEEQSIALGNFLRRNGLAQEQFWLSGTTQAQQGGWYWFSTGKPIATFTNWPNDRVRNTRTSRCLFFSATASGHGIWEDAPCDRTLKFVCENRCPLNSYDVPIFKRK